MPAVANTTLYQSDTYHQPIKVSDLEGETTLSNRTMLSLQSPLDPDWNHNCDLNPRPLGESAENSMNGPHSHLNPNLNPNPYPN